MGMESVVGLENRCRRDTCARARESPFEKSPRIIRARQIFSVRRGRFKPSFLPILFLILTNAGVIRLFSP